MSDDQPYVTIRARQPVGGLGARNGDPSVRLQMQHGNLFSPFALRPDSS